MRLRARAWVSCWMGVSEGAIRMLPLGADPCVLLDLLVVVLAELQCCRGASRRWRWLVGVLSVG